MFGWIPSLLLGLPGFANGLLAYLNKRQDTAALTNGQNVSGDVSVTQAQLAAYVEERKIIAAERAAILGSAATRWMIESLFAFCLLHFGSIVLDTVFHLDWRIERLPGSFDTLEQAIFYAIIGKTGAENVARRIFK